MPLNCINEREKTVITYRGEPAGAYTYCDRVGRVTLAFSCPCTEPEVGLVLGGLQEGLSYLKSRHPRHPGLIYTLQTSIRYEPANDDQRGQLAFSMAYECDIDEWIVPLSYFHRALNRLAAHQEPAPIVVATIEIDEAAIVDTNHNALLLLTEAEIKQNGFVWRFHQNDRDRWPSDPHGHEYERRLKLDVFTGKIYDAATRAYWKLLGKKDLQVIQAKLCQLPAFAAKMQLHAG